MDLCSVVRCLTLDLLILYLKSTLYLRDELDNVYYLQRH